tara:strand:- start:168 stop:866 length:699 start_codon:yes stop_codon:yes gene_type:complete
MARGLIGGIKPQTPTTGSVATGQAYAQQIAGGIPFEQVVAPGLQFSPEAPMGLTQEELDFIAKGPAPVMPVAPTIGEPVAPSIPTMPFAPVGTPMPKIVEKLPEGPEFDFDFDFDFDDIFRDIDARELAEVVEKAEIPSLFENNIPQEGPIMDSSLVMPSAPSIFDVQPISQPMVSQPMSPMNFTGLSQIPYIPPLATPSALTQPRIDIDDIVSPIRSNKLMRTMPNLFNIV